MKNGFVSLHNNIFETLLAVSEEDQAKGLMYVEPPVPNMTFVYAQPKINFFWMKATKAPLDIIFCNGGKVSQICYGEPYSTRIIGDHKYSDLVIELPHGTVERSNIKIGQCAELLNSTKNTIIKELSINHLKY